MPIVNMTAINTTILLETTTKSNVMGFNDPLTLTSKDLLNLCGSFSSQSKVAAMIGLALMIVAFVWFGKYRQDIQEHQKLTDKHMQNIDKLLLMLIALCFAWILAKLYYGG